MKRVEEFIGDWLPYILGIIVALCLFVIHEKMNIGYRNLKGLHTVLESMISILSIVIGFYAAFYGIIISLSDSKVMRILKRTNSTQKLEVLLISSLISSFLELILTIAFQILINYNCDWIFWFYLFWGFVAVVFFVFAFKTAIFSIFMIFDGGITNKQIKTPKP